MLYKEDWQETKERLTAFWDGQWINRPCIAMVYQSQEYVHPQARDFEQKWTDPEFILQDHLAACKAHYFGGEACPTVVTMVGFAFAYNAPLIFTDRTILHKPIFKAVKDYQDFDFDYCQDWGWRQCQDVAGFLARAGVGEFGGPAQLAVLQANDLLAVLRGTENFLTDLVFNPNEVKAALKKMGDNWLKATLRLDEIAKTQGMEGSANWLNIWSPKTTAALESDVSCMISPAMFAEFIVPELVQAADAIDHVFYHLDGPDAIKHLDRILEIDGIFGIQWQPGAGQSTEIEDWLDLYKRIQAKGKGLFMPGIPKEKLEFAIKELNPKGLFLNVYGAESVEDVQETLKEAEKLTAKYW